jgi:hypothetical protein
LQDFLKDLTPEEKGLLDLNHTRRATHRRTKKAAKPRRRG